MRKNYKFYYREDGVLTIQYFRTLKQINSFIEKTPIIPIQISKYETSGLYLHYKVWACDILC